MTVHAGKTATEPDAESTAIHAIRDGSADVRGRASGRSVGIARSFAGTSAARGFRRETKRTRRRRSEAERCRLGQDLQAWVETPGLFQISRALLLPDDAGPKLRQPRHVAADRRSDQGAQRGGKSDQAG